MNVMPRSELDPSSQLPPTEEAPPAEGEVFAGELDERLGTADEEVAEESVPGDEDAPPPDAAEATAESGVAAETAPRLALLAALTNAPAAAERGRLDPDAAARPEEGAEREPQARSSLLAPVPGAEPEPGTAPADPAATALADAAVPQEVLPETDGEPADLEAVALAAAGLATRDVGRAPAAANATTTAAPGRGDPAPALADSSQEANRLLASANAQSGGGADSSAFENGAERRLPAAPLAAETGAGAARPVAEPASFAAALQATPAAGNEAPPADAALAPGAATVPQATGPGGLTSATPPGTPPTPAENLPTHIEWLAARGGGRARVSLHPPNLGAVELSVTVRGNQVEVVVAAHESAAQSLVNEQRQTLFDQLAQRDLRMGHFEVRSLNREDTGREGGAPGQSGHRGDRDERGAADGPMDEGAEALPGLAARTHEIQNDRVDMRI